MTHHNQSALRGLINELLNGDEELPVKSSGVV